MCLLEVPHGTSFQCTESVLAFKDLKGSAILWYQVSSPVANIFMSYPVDTFDTYIRQNISASPSWNWNLRKLSRAVNARDVHEEEKHRQQ